MNIYLTRRKNRIMPSTKPKTPISAEAIQTNTPITMSVNIIPIFRMIQ